VFFLAQGEPVVLVHGDIFIIVQQKRFLALEKHICLVQEENALFAQVF
jgi:hypothetical protein